METYTAHCNSVEPQ